MTRDPDASPENRRATMAQEPCGRVGNGHIMVMWSIVGQWRRILPHFAGAVGNSIRRSVHLDAIALHATPSFTLRAPARTDGPGRSSVTPCIAYRARRDSSTNRVRAFISVS